MARGSNRTARTHLRRLNPPDKLTKEEKREKLARANTESLRMVVFWYNVRAALGMGMFGVIVALAWYVLVSLYNAIF